MKLTSIRQIKKSKKKKAYDIHHKIGEKYFYENHPNFVANGYIISNCSRHAGGLCITENAIEQLPVIKSGGVVQTPWTEGLNFRHLESFGFLKFDILGLGTLRLFENTIRRILKRKHGYKNVTFNDIYQWYYQNLHPDNNNLDDINVYQHVFWNKHFAGIFQFVKPNVQNFISKMKPRSIVDLAICTSIHRPGPLGLGADKQYLENRKNPDKIQYQHSLLKEVLHETSGILLFQEQLQLIYHKLAGVPLEDTDAVRKAFTKKDISNKEKNKKEIERLKKDFIQKCQEVNGIDPKVSESIFDYVEVMTSYSFNKSLSEDTQIDIFDNDHNFIKRKRISNVKPGDIVKTRNENTKEDSFTKIIDNHDHGKIDVYEIEFDNGKTVKCSMDHKFRTTDGRMLPIKQILEEGLDVVFDTTTIQCNGCGTQSAKHKNNCPIITGIEGIDYVKCNICGHTAKILTSHLRKEHGLHKDNYKGKTCCDKSYYNRSKAQKGKENWITKYKREDPEYANKKFKEMSEKLSQKIMNDPRERQRRSETMKENWHYYDEYYREMLSKKAKETSKRPEILKRRTENLRKWRENNPDKIKSLGKNLSYHNKVWRENNPEEARIAMEKALKYRTSHPEKLLYDYLINRFPQMNFKLNQFVYDDLFNTKTKTRQLDIVSWGYKIVVEFDGIHHFKEFAHDLYEKQNKDLKLEQILSRKGYHIIRISYDQYDKNKKDFNNDCINKLFETVKNNKLTVTKIGENYNE